MFFSLVREERARVRRERWGLLSKFMAPSSPPLCVMISFMKTEAVFSSKNNKHQGSWEPESISDNINSFFHHER